jgi:hypothetical protein
MKAAADDNWDDLYPRNETYAPAKVIVALRKCVVCGAAKGKPCVEGRRTVPHVHALRRTNRSLPADQNPAIRAPPKAPLIQVSARVGKETKVYSLKGTALDKMRSMGPVTWIEHVRTQTGQEPFDIIAELFTYAPVWAGPSKHEGKWLQVPNREVIWQMDRWRDLWPRRELGVAARDSFAEKSAPLATTKRDASKVSPGRPAAPLTRKLRDQGPVLSHPGYPKSGRFHSLTEHEKERR